jgi:putative ABC transport system permease protein
MIASRTAEIGVRLALGAAPSRILWGVVRQGVLLGAVAVAVGLAGAAAASRVLRAVLFNVTGTDPVTYVVVAVTLLATIALATVLPAMRAARIDPLVAIRQ